MNPYLSSPSSFDETNYQSPKSDLFLNYSFNDIGKSFISHLRRALNHNGFTISDHHTKHPFVGQNVSLELLKAIEESEIFVVVFSTNYASSIRCLNELVDILDCFHKFDNRKLVPVFYKVEPSHITCQKGPFMEAFQAHETNVDPQIVQKWKQALKDAGRVSGLILKNGDEATFVMEIVEEIKKMQDPQYLHVTDHPVGIRPRADELISKLRLDCNDVLVVAVFGFSGIGKTTIVKATYNRISANFEISCFLADMYYYCRKQNWKSKLQKELISYLTQNDKHPLAYSHNDGVTKIRKLISHRKVLLVLDDVDNFQQLEALGIESKWFYSGSRIIVTTRDKRSLGNIAYTSYNTMLLNRRESFNLFIRLTFAKNDPMDTEFVEEVVDSAGGIPLVLKVWSRHFKHHERRQWASVLETLKRIPHDDVQKQLQMSYDSLTNYRSKKLFLDIACFFDDMDKDFVVRVLQDEDSAFFPINEITYLVDRSLVETTSDSKLRMHHAIREMGQEIVRQENEDDPGLRTRLWDEKDVIHVLTESTGTKSVESIILESREIEEYEELTANVETFRNMRNLRLIKLNIYISWTNSSHDDMTPLSFKNLKYMEWDWFPFTSINDIDMRNVVVLRLHCSNLKILWEGFKSLKKLRILDVSFSSSLTKTGDFYGLENLEELDLTGCETLKELHTSVGCLHKLAILELMSSIPIKWIPWEMIGKLRSLQELILSDSTCTELPYFMHSANLWSSSEGCPIWSKHLENNKFPSNTDSLLGLHELNRIRFLKCANIRSIPKLPPSITYMNAFECRNLVNLPSNMPELKSLTVLDFRWCPKLGSEDPQFLMKITGLTNLHDLYLRSCSAISHVPSEIGNLVSLKRLHLSGSTFCSLPDSFSDLLQLVYLNINYCDQLLFLPLLPYSLTDIKAYGCHSLDVMPFDLMPKNCFFHTNDCKELHFINGLVIHLSLMKMPDWPIYEYRRVSFYAPMQLDKKFCGMIVGLYDTRRYGMKRSFTFKIVNITKNTSHLVRDLSCREDSVCIMFYPLDFTTLEVEPGDTVVLEVVRHKYYICDLRLIYDSGVLIYPPIYGKIKRRYE